MTKDDKSNLLHFITRTSMFVNPVDNFNVVSFIHGYELGRKRKCDLTQLIKQLLKQKYNVSYSSDGWPGQITRQAKNLSLSWVTTFKITVLEILADEREGGLDKSMIDILKNRIIWHIGRVNADGDPWFDENWSEEWFSICSIESKWFKQLWTDNEWVLIKSIDKLVKSDNIFNIKGGKIPTHQLLKLKEQFDRAIKKNGT